MYFQHQSVKIQIQCPLCKFRDKDRIPGKVGRIAQQGDVGHLYLKLYGDPPQGSVTQLPYVVIAEPAVNRVHLPGMMPEHALYGAYPQTQVRIYGVFHKHMQRSAPEGFLDFFHQEGIVRGSGSFPDRLQPGFDHLFHMTGRGHLGTGGQAKFLLDSAQPGQPGFSYSFKSARPRTWLPDSGAKKRNAPASGSGMQTEVLELCGG